EVGSRCSLHLIAASARSHRPFAPNQPGRSCRCGDERAAGPALSLARRCGLCDNRVIDYAYLVPATEWGASTNCAVTMRRGEPIASVENEGVPMSSVRAGMKTPLGRRTLLRAGPLAALGLSAAGALAACGGGSGGDGEAGDGTGELNLIYMGDAAQQETFQSLFDEFQSSHPEITLNANGIAAGDWATFGNTVSTRIAGGERADIISVATEGQRLMSSKGLFEPLDELIDRDSAETEEFYDNVSSNLQ